MGNDTETALNRVPPLRLARNCFGTDGFRAFLLFAAARKACKGGVQEGETILLPEKGGKALQLFRGVLINYRVIVSLPDCVTVTDKNLVL